MTGISKIHILYIVFAAAVFADKREVEDVKHAPIIRPSSTMTPNTLNTEAIQKQQEVNYSFRDFFDWGGIKQILKETSPNICFFCSITINVQTPNFTEKNGEVQPGVTATTKAVEDPVEDTTRSIDDNRESCQCAPYYLCERKSENDRSSGKKIGRQCQGDNEVCCIKLLEPVLDTEIVTEPAKPMTCGFRNPQGLGTPTRNESMDISEAWYGEFPWVVAILNILQGDFGDEIPKVYSGVGALIHPNVVMTGAHIAAKFEPGVMLARAGEWDTDSSDELYEYQERTVTEVYIPQDFQPKNLHNGAALLRLSKPMVLSDHIKVICLPEQDESFDNYTKCIASGWGKNGFGRRGNYSKILKKIEVDMVDYERCNMLLKRTRLTPLFKLPSSFVCAGGEGGKDTCQGDGGAPLVCPIGNEQYKLAGMVAWSIGCGEKDVPAVYIKVAAFRRWVDNKMAEWGYVL